MGFQADSIVFSYGDRKVLDGLSFALEPGCFYGVLGPNGCGKSTLIDLLMGLHRPQSGKIRYNGHAIGSYPRRKLARELALVPQNFYINFPFTALEVVMMGRYPHMPRFSPPSAEDVAVVEEVMARTDTLPFAHRYMTEMSGGERQRIIFARALVQDTPVLMLDEATSNLDIHHTLTLLDRVAGLVQTERRTVIAVFQDLNLASAYSQEIVMVKAGRVVAAGPTAEVFTPQNLKRVFDVQARVAVDDFTGRLQVRYKRS